MRSPLLPTFALDLVDGLPTFGFGRYEGVEMQLLGEDCEYLVAIGHVPFPAGFDLFERYLVKEADQPLWRVWGCDEPPTLEQKAERVRHLWAVVSTHCDEHAVTVPFCMWCNARLFEGPWFATLDEHPGLHVTDMVGDLRAPFPVTWWE
jgi:hypothetical protein